MSRYVSTILAVMFLASVSVANVCAGEIEELQGKWETKFQENGRQMRAIKIIKGDTDTTETYDGERLVHRHVSKVEFVASDGFVIMKWGESEVTDGPRKGSKGASGSCMTKRAGKKWYHVHGLKVDEKYPPSLQEFTRIDDKS